MMKMNGNEFFILVYLIGINCMVIYVFVYVKFKIFDYILDFCMLKNVFNKLNVGKYLFKWEIVMIYICNIW